jgi:hypothetical protein
MAHLNLTAVSKNVKAITSRSEGFNSDKMSDIISVQSSIPAMPGNAQFTYDNGAVKEVYTVTQTVSEIIDLQYHS